MVNDLPLLDEEFQLISFHDLIRIANNSRKAIVETIPVEDSGKTLGQDSLDAVELDHKHSMFATGALTKVMTGDDEVTRGDCFRKPGSLVFKNMLGKSRKI